METQHKGTDSTCNSRLKKKTKSHDTSCRSVKRIKSLPGRNVCAKSFQQAALVSSAGDLLAPNSLVLLPGALFRSCFVCQEQSKPRSNQTNKPTNKPTNQQRTRKPHQHSRDLHERTRWNGEANRSSTVDSSSFNQLPAIGCSVRHVA